MPRVKRQGPLQRRRDLTPDERAILMGGDLINKFSFFVSDAEMREAWEFARDALLREWIRTRPGTRPPGWWRFDWPKKPRRRLGGVGTSAGDPAYVEDYEKGIPSQWVDPWDVLYFTGRQVDVEGLPIGLEFLGSDFDGVAPDPNDPPLYESEAAFLKRLGHLLPGEQARIPAQAFEPVAIHIEGTETVL
ncbi:MAG: hypothetical protein Q8N53_05710 [Longimicrobiales bacterium]|nr:hypothetical protein [Longimicrobiales bacterium]